jgi:hypothetical protein
LARTKKARKKKGEKMLKKKDTEIWRVPLQEKRKKGCMTKKTFQIGEKIKFLKVKC